MIVLTIVLQSLLYGLAHAIIPSDPMITAAPYLEARDNGANIIGYELSGGTWDPRSCATGFYSTSGTLGNCCTNDNCPFITTCIGDFVYVAGTSANCGQLCGTGTIYHTAGDQNPLYMFNCDSDWIVTMSVTSGAIGSTTIINSPNTPPGSRTTTPPSTSSTSPPSSGGSSSSSTAKIIAGSVVGGMAVVGILLLAVVFLCLKGRRKQASQPPTNFAQSDYAYNSPAAPPPGMAQYQVPQYQQAQYAPNIGMPGTGTIPGTGAMPASPGQEWKPYQEDQRRSELLGSPANVPVELPSQGR